MSYNKSVGFNTEEDMRIDCPHCESKALITGHNRLAISVRDIYCTCINQSCGWRGVMTLSHKHDTHPPTSEHNSLLAAMLSNMNPSDRNAVLVQAGIAS